MSSFICYDIFPDINDPNDTQYSNHRIPGMIITDKGTVIIYTEARRTGSDWAHMDIFCRRSSDHGKTFGSPIYLAYGSDRHATVNNPVMMQDKNGRIHFLHCESYGINGGRILRRYSDDDGLTWSDPIDITASTMPDYRNAFALGPGHGICTKTGTLLVPIWMVPKSFGSPLEEHHPSVLSTLYSTNQGESWQLGDILPTTTEIHSPNETVAVELSDGRIYLSIRNRTHRRAQAISADGYTGWTDYLPVPELIDPICFGSVAVYNRPDTPHTLLFANCEHLSERKNVVLKGSIDNGKTWTLRRVIDADRGGYVECAVDNTAGLIYVFYEDKAGLTDHLAVLTYDDLLPL
ncbi:MAG: exo-alpha-sialidase [Ruminococcaceae bacterium]|nr:exo-alpha-sialidase [Oscillospiraceae bacterium]